MKLIVFGASGNCGALFVRHAASRGHQVTAVVRGSSHAAPDGVRVERGEVLDPGFVAAAIGGHDAVMSGLGMRYKHPFARLESPLDFTSRATRHIVDGMKAAGLRRISIISAAGVGDSRPALNWPMQLMLAVSNVGKAYDDMERVERVLQESGLDWQAVRPVTLNHRPGRGNVQVVSRYRVRDTISREDVATYMLDELERPSFTHRTPMIAGG
jgi:putative NADH-flavin reductase